MGVLLFTISALFVFWSPFTKVEESFNMQATHDILVHSFNITEYDHLEFPGVVPRTFIAPLMLSASVSPIFGLLELIEAQKFWAQYLVRFAMAAFVAAAWHLFRRTIIEKLGINVGAWFTLITITQFHFLFYMSRLLPNIIALPLTLLAIRFWIRRDVKWFIASAGAVIIIFRSELCILFGLLLLYDIYYKRITLPEFLKVGVVAGILLVSLTVVVDSIFWQRLLWPELEVLWFNTVMNKSSEWGTSPFLWYFYSALPRALGSSLLLIPFGLYYESRIRALVVPAIFYILLYSFLPHKELRFIIYVFPIFNLAAACACSRFWENREKSLFRSILAYGAAAHLLFNCFITMFLLLISRTNYPGGVAMSRLHRIVPEYENATIYIGNLAAQTGVTRFTELNKDWIYSKNESLKPGDAELHDFKYLLVEAKDKYSPEMRLLTQTHEILEFVECFSNIGLEYSAMFPIKIKTKPCIYIMERKKDAKFVVDLAGDAIDDDTSIEEFIETLSEKLEIDDQLSKEIDEEFDKVMAVSKEAFSNEDDAEKDLENTQSEEKSSQIHDKSPSKVRTRLARIKSDLKKTRDDTKEEEKPKFMRKSREKRFFNDETSEETRPERRTRLREIFKEHFRKVQSRQRRDQDQSSTQMQEDTTKARLKKLIKTEQVKALVEDIQKLEICDPSLSPKECLKQIIDEYIAE
ncbi:probable Dol-P-Man:Man(7)GlcNAc(2)-PP-Dol alpha-1,6-mannosyltransferase [Culicoides brevitarsis]|uniref:probable Dol-P-Man:Man(7)GlcNAc(2)-PP-Dol alpha-1,6-mannosyltransferase n=1 Tax=Culicoides brevitarsis TaxID=469753 RepID=UPI00307B7433